MEIGPQSWAEKIYDLVVWAQLQLTRNERRAIAEIALLWARHSAKIPAALDSQAAHIRDLNRARRAMVSLEFAAILEDYAIETSGIIKQEMTEAAAFMHAAVEDAIISTAPEVFDIVPFNHIAQNTALSGITDGEFLGTSLKAWEGKVARATMIEMGRTWAMGMAEGWDMQQMANAIGREFGRARNSAIRLSRTAIMAASNRSRDRAFKANRRLIKGEMHIATLDTNTCPECAELDGHVYGPEDSQPSLPIHPGCRCVYSAVMRSAEELGLGIIDLPPGVRESMDGAVPATLHYPEWFKRQTNTRQSEIIALQFSKTKARAFERGQWKPPFWEQANMGFKDCSMRTQRALAEAEMQFREAINAD